MCYCVIELSFKDQNIAKSLWLSCNWINCSFTAVVEASLRHRAVWRTWVYEPKAKGQLWISTHLESIGYLFIYLISNCMQTHIRVLTCITFSMEYVW